MVICQYTVISFIMSNLKDYQNKTQKLFQVSKSEFERLPILSFKTK